MSCRKEWDAFVLYLEEHPGSFDKQERMGIKWADLEIKRLTDIMERQNGELKKLGIRIHKMKNKVFYSTAHAKQAQTKLRRASIAKSTP